MKQQPYIMQRGDRFYFRIRIPVSLRYLFNDRNEIRKPLGTGNPRLAMRLSQHLYLACIDGFEQMKDIKAGFGQILLTTPDGSKIEIDHKDDSLSAKESAALELEQALALQKQALELQLQHNKQPATSTKTEKGTPEPILLDQLVQDFIDYKTKEDAWSANTLQGNKIILKGLIEKLSNPPIDQINAQSALKYREALIDSGLKDGSINTHIRAASSLFNWATQFDFVTKNNFKTLTVKVKVKSSTLRNIYTPGDLSKAFPYRALRPHHKWIPVIALYSGMRLNEICQLYVDDIQEEDGVWCFNVREEHSDQSVKTLSGTRLVPVHNKLKELGFLDYVAQKKAQKHQRLFEKLRHSKTKGYGAQMGKWWNQRCKGLGVPSFHSFRHTVADQLKQKGNDKVIVSEIVGHSNSEDITFGTYGKEYQPSNTVKVINQLEYGIPEYWL